MSSVPPPRSMPSSALAVVPQKAKSMSYLIVECVPALPVAFSTVVCSHCTDEINLEMVYDFANSWKLHCSLNINFQHHSPPPPYFDEQGTSIWTKTSSLALQSWVSSCWTSMITSALSASPSLLIAVCYLSYVSSSMLRTRQVLKRKKEYK